MSTATLRARTATGKVCPVPLIVDAAICMAIERSTRSLRPAMQPQPAGVWFAALTMEIRSLRGETCDGW